MNDASAHGTYMVRLPSGQEFGPAPMELVITWAEQRRVPIDALLVPSDGAPVRSVLSEPRLRSILQAPPTAPTAPVTSSAPLGGVVIPTGNPCALTGYYLAVFSLIAFPLAPIALILGIVGLRARLKKPAIHGLAHAIFAIVVGLLVTMGAAFFFAMVIPRM